MAGKQGSGPKGAAPVADRPDAIRNVVLVGPAGSGKTTLVETLLVTAGVLNRAGSTLEGSTVSDFDEAEQRQQRSVGLALAPLRHRDVKVNLLDAPGYADFVGELRAGLRAADCAMFVLAANEGVDQQTRTLWRECAEVEMPRVVVVTKLDHARADYDGTVAHAREAFGDKVLPVYLREGERLVGLLTGEPDDADGGHAQQRAALIEGVIEESEDETLMERYVGGEEVDAALLVQDLERAVARGLLPPGGARRRHLGPRCVRAARPGRGRPPVTGRAPAARGVHAGGPHRAGAALRPRRPAGRRGGQDDHRRVRRTGQPGPGLLRDRPARRHRARLGPPVRRSSGPRTGTRTTTRTSGSARCRCRWEGGSGRSGGWSPATSARRPALPRRDRGHPVRPGHPAGAEALDDARAAAPDRRRGAGQAPTRTSWARDWRG